MAERETRAGPVADREDGFLARWSRRKAEARREQERAASEPDVADASNDATASPQPTVVPDSNAPCAEPHFDDSATASSAPAVPATEPAADRAIDAHPARDDAGEEERPLTLADVARLTRDSDFSPFVSRAVEPQVRNAALKKLFADPHFNVMDGLDVYIDDYNKVTPVPQALIAQFAQAKFLGLVGDWVDRQLESAAADALGGRADAPADVAQDAVAPLAVADGALDHPATTDVAPDTVPDDVPRADEACPDEDADLQLQPHDAAGRSDALPDAGELGGRER